MATIQDKLSSALRARGHQGVPTRSAKYLVFTSPTPGEFYFVGKAGGLRKGRTVTDSHSLEGLGVKENLLKEWSAASKKSTR